MSEYLLLNPGPNYSPEAKTSWSYRRRPRSEWPQSPSTSSAGAGTTRRLPSRPTYILGIEPYNQILLVPIFEEKDYRRKDVNINVIGPKEKCWDLIRGFQVTPLSDGLRETTVVENLEAGSVIGSKFDMTNNGIIDASDYDEFVARSLAWEEENGGSDYEQLVERSGAWDEENGGEDYERFASRSRAWDEEVDETTEAEGEHVPAECIADKQAVSNSAESKPLNPLDALDTSLITDPGKPGQSCIPEITFEDLPIDDSPDDGLYEDSVATARNGEQGPSISSKIIRQPSVTCRSPTTPVRSTRPMTQTKTSSPEDSDSDGWVDNDLEIAILASVRGDGQIEEQQKQRTNDQSDEETFEFIERDEAFHH